MEPMLDATDFEGQCRFYLAKQDYDVAIPFARNMVNILQKIGGRLFYPVAHLLLGRSYMGAGQEDLADEAFKTALIDAEALELVWPRWQILVSQADLMEACGKIDEAAPIRERAKQDFEAIAGKIAETELRLSFQDHPLWNMMLMNHALG